MNNITDKDKCLGCEACVQVCTHNAISMKEDKEGFRYPLIDNKACVDCGLCSKICPIENPPLKNTEHLYTFGGYIKDEQILKESTSGGALTAIVMAWAYDNNWIAFGATSNGLDVYHTYVDDVKDLGKLRKSKYSQSKIGQSYKDVKTFLKTNKRVLFAGTPCQIAGLLNYLGKTDMTNLLTVEVICEGVPSPLYIRRLDNYMFSKYGSRISDLDYRHKVYKSLGSPMKWDFEVMQASLRSGRAFKKDRWFNPFWSIWLKHLMSRPSCYQCPFATRERVADITLGDLWGVHIYCPDLYNKNRGSSLVICNSTKGMQIVKKAVSLMDGHELAFDDAIKYQSPLRKHIDTNPMRDSFMEDLIDPDMDYLSLIKKWATPPSLKLLWTKYVWGNYQKVAWWNIKKKIL